MDVTRRIKSLMAQRGWTIYRLGKESGLSQSTLAHIFRKDSAPTIATLETICNTFGITLSEFFDVGGGPELNDYQMDVIFRWGGLSTPEQRQVLKFMIDLVGENPR